ncbi:MAG: DUF2147 domain-containing protein [Pseudomonadota bacterium]
MLTLMILMEAALSPLNVTGVWYTEGQLSQVEITEDGDSVVGRIIWYEDWEEDIILDTKNPDETLRDRELLGLPILAGFREGNEKWRRGQIYDPTDGKSYRSAIYRVSDDRLGVEGCVSVICRKMEWQRVPEDQIMRSVRTPE